jgi:MFS family permease
MAHSQPKASTRSLASIVTASSVGTIIEWYDFYIFASLATIIATRFFPKENPTAAFLATFATFSAGLVVRPFGALVFGRLGDLIGRKYTFMVTLVLMGGSTFAIGLVPEYERIGFLAPVIVLILRLSQGLAIGGEYGGAATFVAEHAPIGKRGFWTSWIQTTTTIGLVLSMCVILISKSSMGAAAWENWCWRIPFLASALMIIISVWIRRSMAESPLFAKAKSEGKTSVNPLRESFGNK